MNELKFKKYIGKEIEKILSPLADLRITVFCDFPYLYEGTHEYEMSYLQTYVNAEKAMVFTVWDNNEMVGACTCIPLTEEMQEVQKPFIDRQLPIEKIFYFGESILIKSYRGNGIGHRFFDEREKHAASFNTYSDTYFCSVIRPENHTLKPDGYYPNDVFWTKRNYEKVPDLTCKMSWKDIDEQEESYKELVFWHKSI